MRQRICNIQRKLKNSGGATLGELLAATLILLLAVSILTAVASLAYRQYLKSIRGSEAQVLCSTLRNAISDELAYTTDVETSGATHQLTYYYSRRGYKESNFTVTDPDSGGYGYITIANVENPEEHESLLGSGAYSNGLRAKVSDITYDPDSDCFTVELSIGYGGTEYYGQQFQVLNVNKAG